MLLAGVSDASAAAALADRIWKKLCEPIETEKGVVQVGACIGVVMIEPGSKFLIVDRLHALADGEMFVVKHARVGGGVRFWQPGQPAPARPKAGRRRLASGERGQSS